MKSCQPWGECLTLPAEKERWIIQMSGVGENRAQCVCFSVSLSLSLACLLKLEKTKLPWMKCPNGCLFKFFRPTFYNSEREREKIKNVNTGKGRKESGSFSWQSSDSSYSIWFFSFFLSFFLLRCTEPDEKVLASGKSAFKTRRKPQRDMMAALTKSEKAPLPGGDSLMGPWQRPCDTILT